jgi:hypothetical protein
MMFPIHYQIHLKTLGKLELAPKPYQTCIESNAAAAAVDPMAIEQQLVDQLEALNAEVPAICVHR